MSSVDLSSILTSSRALNAHLQTRPDLPTVNLGLDQVELQSRKLVNRYTSSASADTGRGNFLLAQANVDAPSLTNSIAALNTSSTFTPLRPLLDTDVSGYLRHAHEQTLISTIEEGRRETETEFYQVLEERTRRDWESRKKRIFEELGRHALTETSNPITTDLRGSTSVPLSSSFLGSSHPSLQMHHKMMAYDRVVSELTTARIGGVSYPIVQALLQAAMSLNGETSGQMQGTLHILLKIIKEPPVYNMSHGNAHLLNSPMYERKYARAYLNRESVQEAHGLRTQIVKGAKEALEEQYWDVMERTISSNPSQASLGGDPSASNHVRAYLAVKYYRSGQWDDHLEILNGRPLWAQLFYLIRAGRAEDAVDLATKHKSALDSRQRDFCSLFQKWAMSSGGRMGDANRNIFRTHLEHSPTVDPFKTALFKLMGRVEPNKRNVPYVTGTTEDWIWFQLAMLEETSHSKDSNSLKELAEVLLGYGERHFEGAPGQKENPKYGVWAKVMLICGEFERAVSALYDRPETQVEAIHFAIALAYHGLLRITPRADATDTSILTISYNRPPSINFSLMIARYIRQFIRTDPKEAIQYVYCICLNADQGNGTGQEQIEAAWDLCRKVIAAAESTVGWEDLVGGVRQDGVKFSGDLERALILLKLNTARYHEVILLPAARLLEKENRITEAIKLYNLAESPDTVLACLARALSDLIADPSSNSPDLEKTATDILRHYGKTNKGLGKAKDTVVKLLQIRAAQEAWEKGYLDAALQAIEASQLFPLDGDLTTVTKFSEDFKHQDETIVRNLHIFLPLTMDILHKQHDNIKRAAHSEAARQSISIGLRTKSRSLVMFAGMLRYRMPAEIYNRLLEKDVDIAL
ncbi:hypothetical protein Clacol_003634 [Clathrus columnatus]|uniref:Nuclear pore protein n=1 Tax=Clathrus columnatus TaxID=1419009 RepID=A0AAV5A6X0_9AGAM|nr:hypothetical protein Clacol_003634 [Clathrus columnatus]